MIAVTYETFFRSRTKAILLVVAICVLACILEHSAAKTGPLFIDGNGETMIRVGDANYHSSRCICSDKATVMGIML